MAPSEALARARLAQRSAAGLASQAPSTHRRAQSSFDPGLNTSSSSPAPSDAASKREVVTAYLEVLLKAMAPAATKAASSNVSSKDSELELSTMLFQINREIRQAATLKDAFVVFNSIKARKLSSGLPVRPDRIVCSRCLR